MKAWDAAAYDWVVFADSNVLIPPDYLDQLFARWSERAAVVCSPPIGVDLQGWAAGARGGVPQHLPGALAARQRRGGPSPRARRCSCGAAISPEGGLAALTSEVAEDAAATKLAPPGPPGPRRGPAVPATSGAAHLRRGVAASAARAAAPAVVPGLFLPRASRPAACFPAFSRLGSRARASCRGRASRR